jgi:hypothetical protein
LFYTQVASASGRNDPDIHSYMAMHGAAVQEQASASKHRQNAAKRGQADSILASETLTRNDTVEFGGVVACLLLPFIVLLHALPL